MSNASRNTNYVNAVNDYLSGLTEKNLECIVALYADNATIEDPVGSDVLEGIEAIKAFYVKALSMDLTAELSGPTRVAGQEIAFPFQLTIGGKMQKVMHIIEMFQFNDEGKIQTMRAFWGPENVKSV